MGYPMSWDRLCRRNTLSGDYTSPGLPGDSPELLAYRRFVAGDLRRIEQDQRDEKHLAFYAERTGLTAEQVKAVLDILFDQDSWCGAAWRHKLLQPIAGREGP